MGAILYFKEYQPAAEDTVVFLTDLFENGLGYASICSA